MMKRLALISVLSDVRELFGGARGTVMFFKYG